MRCEETLRIESTRMRNLSYSFTLIFSGLLICHIASAENWPHWRGLNRDDVSSESSGWNGKEWIERELWSAQVGEGSSSPIIVDSKVYLTGWSNGIETLRCLDFRNGKELWKQSNKSPRYGRVALGDQSLYSGVSSTPEFDPETGLLFTLGIYGDLRAWNTEKSGEQAWNLNLYEKYQAARRPEVAKRRKTRRDYGYTSSPLVLGEELIVEVGGNRGNLIAFDKNTGRELWHSQNKDEAGHTGGPVPITIEGVPCVAVLTLRNVVVTRIDSDRKGETVATFPWTTDFGNNIATLAVLKDTVLVTSSYNQAAMARVHVSLSGAEELWRNQSVASGVCSPIIHDGQIYWAWRGVHCLDLETGKELWTGGKVGTQGSCILTADDRLIVFANKGDLTLVETAKRSQNKYVELDHQKIFNKTDAWPHVVLSGRNLICRDRSGHVKCLRLKSK